MKKRKDRKNIEMKTKKFATIDSLAKQSRKVVTDGEELRNKRKNRRREKKNSIVLQDSKGQARAKLWWLNYLRLRI